MNFRKTFLIKERIYIDCIQEFRDKPTVFYRTTETLRPLGWLIFPFIYLFQGFIDGFPSTTKDYIEIIKDKGRVWNGGLTHNSKEKFIENYGKKLVNDFEGNKEN